MKTYLNINIDELGDTKKRYKEICDELETIEKIVTDLINQFAQENSSKTADKIIEIMEEYGTIITTNIDLFDQLYDSVDEFLELIDEMLEPSSYDNIVVDFDELVVMRNELAHSLDSPIPEINLYISRAETAIEEEIEYLKRKMDDLDFEEIQKKQTYFEQINNLKHNKRILNELRHDLRKYLNFEDELEQIDRQIINLEEFINEETKLGITHIEDTLNELEAFKLEVNIQALNALLPQEITSDIMDQVLGKLELTSRQQLTDKINELKQTGMFDNFYANVRTQVELMGLEAFLSDSERIKWLADNPGIRVGGFSSDLTPNQLRILCEELPYVLFSKNLNGEYEFKSEFYDWLTDGTLGRDVALNSEGTKLVFTDYFINAGLTFEKINKPGTDEPWYIDEEGFQAVAMRVNGEIVIMYPGSQEVHADWIMTDLFPNLLHEVPEQYNASDYFAAAVQAKYPEEEIILTGQSLAGGSVEYAGNVNDMMSFGIDPAPGKVIDPDGDKGITVIPGGTTGGLLNNIKSSDSGYNQSNTNVGILYPISILGGPTLMLSNLWGQSNDKPSEQELAYLNSISERDDLTAEEIDDIKALGPNDREDMDTLLGEHFVGYLDDYFQYAYVPRGVN